MASGPGHAGEREQSEGGYAASGMGIRCPARGTWCVVLGCTPARRQPPSPITSS